MPKAREILAEAGGPLRVPDHDAEAALAQLVGGVVEGRAEAEERCLEEDPARARRSLRDRLELVLAHALDHAMSQLAAHAQLERDPLAREGKLEFGHAHGQLGYVGDVSGPDVRRGDRHGRAVRDGVRGERKRLAQIGRAVVHARQHV